MKRIILSMLLALMAATPVLAKDYVIGEGDGLAITVWGEQNLSVSLRVLPDGKISMPGVGEVLAAGKTSAQLQELLAERLKGLVKYEPNVTVMVTDFVNSKAYLFGGGVTPGVFELKRRTTLLQLLCSVEDVRLADLRHAYVLRGGVKVKENFHKLLIDGATEEDILIEPEDSIFVPPFTEKNIYVLGAVNQPRYVLFRDNLTVMEAILEAGGFNKFANENQTVIIRREGDTQVTIPIKAKDLIKGGDITQNVVLQVGDYVIAKEGLF